MTEVKYATIRVRLESYEADPGTSASRSEIEAALADALGATKFCFTPDAAVRQEWLITSAEAVGR